MDFVIFLIVIIGIVFMAGSVLVINDICTTGGRNIEKIIANCRQFKKTIINMRKMKGR